MPFLIAPLVEAVFTVALIILLGTGILIATAIVRRKQREKYFQDIDRLRGSCGPIIAALLQDRFDYDLGLAALRDIFGADHALILEQLLLAEKGSAAAHGRILRQLSNDLGLIELWQQRLTGHLKRTSFRDALSRPGSMLEGIGPLSFLLRAKSAANLGTIRHQPSWPLLVEALNDPHPDLQAVATRSLADIGEPQSFPLLVERLHGVILNPSDTLSLRTVKAALVRFPLELSVGFLPSLGHSHPRIRFLATDIIREMVERQATLEKDFALRPEIFDPELTEAFLTKLVYDENPDVRARAGPVIAYLEDPRATGVLLTLLDDTHWFVRLHAVRALANQKVRAPEAHLARRLTDPHWRVREAAAGALLKLGPSGIDQLLDHFLTTQDCYSQEQIAEEMQRAGLIPSLFSHYGGETYDRQTKAIQRLTEMGKTSHLQSMLQNGFEPERGKEFLKDLSSHPDPRMQAVGEELANADLGADLQSPANLNGWRAGSIPNP